jgi:hypothetical protein
MALPGFTATASLTHRTYENSVSVLLEERNRLPRLLLEAEYMAQLPTQKVIRDLGSQFPLPIPILPRPPRDRPSRLCIPPFSRCGRDCVNKYTDNLNCGSCGNICPIGSQCIFGGCICNNPDEIICEEDRGPEEGRVKRCVNVNNGEWRHCGGCNMECDQLCFNGQCGPCQNDSQCSQNSPTYPVCERQTGRCVECSSSNLFYCLPGQVCYNGTCSDCTRNSDCAPGRTCGTITGECTECDPGFYPNSEGYCVERCRDAMAGCDGLGPGPWACGPNGYFPDLETCCRPNGPPGGRTTCCNPNADRCDPSYCYYNANECP